MMRSSVDLPQPDGPRMVMNSPARMSRSMSRNTEVAPNCLAMPASLTAPRGLGRVTPTTLGLTVCMLSAARAGCREQAGA